MFRALRERRQLNHRALLKTWQKSRSRVAVVVVGGLVTSTLLNRFVVPVLYLRYCGPRKLKSLREAQA
jgi:hypothetical protein